MQGTQNTYMFVRCFSARTEQIEKKVISKNMGTGDQGTLFVRCFLIAGTEKHIEKLKKIQGRDIRVRCLFVRSLKLEKKKEKSKEII